MNMNRIRLLAAPALLALAAGAAPAHAQSAAPSAATAPAAASAPMKAMPAPHHMDMVEQRIQTLHDQLNITVGQTRRWNAFAHVIRENAASMQRAFRHRAKALPKMNAAQAMRSYADIAQLHAANMRKLSMAFSHLYAALTPAQKAAADELFRNAHPHAKP